MVKQEKKKVKRKLPKHTAAPATEQAHRLTKHLCDARPPRGQKGRERERGGEGGEQTDRQTGRQTDGQTDRRTDR